MREIRGNLREFPSTHTEHNHGWKAAAIEDALRNSALRLKEKKCVRESRTIEYCGHLNGYGKAKPVLSDRMLIDWPKPRNHQELRKFLGHINCYRDYMPMLAHHATQLYSSLTIKGQWTWQQDLAFLNVKRLTTRMLDMSAFDPAARCTIRITIRMDASLFGIGPQLMQRNQTCTILSCCLTSLE